MLLLQYIPQLSLVALVVLSAFNIGYFSKVGLHFLGVVDISNLVYSFGLVFGVVSLLHGFFGGNYLDSIRKRAAHPDALKNFKRSLLRIWLPCFAAAFAALTFIPQEYNPIDKNPDVGAAIGFAAIVAMSGYGAYVRYRSLNKVDWDDIAFVALIVLLTANYVGRAVAHYQVFLSAGRFRVVTKDNVLENVRIARTSSTGFLLADNGVILFLPLSEIREVRTVAAIKN